MEITGNQYPKSINQLFLDTFNDTGLYQIVEEPTRGNSILDIFLTSNKALHKKPSVISGIGDHEAVQIDSSLCLKRKKPIKHTIKLWKKANLESLKKDAHSFATLFLRRHKHTDSADQMWNCIKKNLHTIMEDNIPSAMDHN